MSEIRALTGLRGIAAMIVFCAHLRETLDTHGLHLDVSPIVQRLFLSGGRQVDIFFVLSGFILSLTYKTWFAGGVGRKSYFKFLQRRFARIYPLHFVMLLLIIGFVMAAKVSGAATNNGLERFHFSALPAHFLLVQSWGFLDTASEWNPPSWSVSVEVLAYLIFPLALWGSCRVSGRHVWTLIVIAVLVGFGLNALTHWGISGFSSIVRGLSEFALGLTVVQLLDGRFAAWLQSRGGSLAAMGGLLACFVLTPDTGFIIGLFTAPLLLSLCAENRVSRFFAWGPVYFLGEISYSIYLGHFIFSSIAYRIVSVEWMKSGTLATLIGTTVIVAFVLLMSTLTYYTIERPGRNLLSGRRRVKTAAAAVDPVTKRN